MNFIDSLIIMFISLIIFTLAILEINILPLIVLLTVLIGFMYGIVPGGRI